jgi:hypothetical protein
MRIAMEVLFRYLVFDDVGEPIRRFRTKHEAECYIIHRPKHRIERLPPSPRENVFDLIREDPLF